MSRMRAGQWGILVASVIRKAPERLHEPLTQILLNMDNLPYDELHHLRRLIEVNIPRGKEKYIQRCEVVCIIDALDHVVDLIQITEERKILEDEKKEDENKRETTH